MLFAGREDDLLLDQSAQNSRATITSIIQRDKGPDTSATPVSLQQEDPAQRFDFVRDGILNTSFELTVIAESQTNAEAADKRVPDEIRHPESITSLHNS